MQTKGPSDRTLAQQIRYQFRDHYIFQPNAQSHDENCPSGIDEDFQALGELEGLSLVIQLLLSFVI